MQGIALTGRQQLAKCKIQTIPVQARRQQTAAEVHRKRLEKANRQQVITVKHIDRETFVLAINATVIGCILLTAGIVAGYYGFKFMKDLDRSKTEMMAYKSLSYIGPVVSGFGAFILMVACVMSLENRDKNAKTMEKPESKLEKLRKFTRATIRDRVITSEQDRKVKNANAPEPERKLTREEIRAIARQSITTLSNHADAESSQPSTTASTPIWDRGSTCLRVVDSTPVSLKKESPDDIIEEVMTEVSTDDRVDLAMPSDRTFMTAQGDESEYRSLQSHQTEFESPKREKDSSRIIISEPTSVIDETL